MWKCSKCNTENLDEDPFCIECATARPKPSTNHCSNPKCTFYKTIVPSQQKYCGKCGTATMYQKEIDKFC